MKTKKILSLLVAMTMLFSCVGITAMAETVNTLDELLSAIENGDGNITLGSDIDLNGNSYVAYIGEQGYETVQAAINAAQNGETVTISAGEYSAINISNKNITIQGTVGDNGELLTTIKGGNPAITGHSFNGTIRDIKIVDAFKVMYAEPAGNVTVDNVYVSGATYGFHLVAYSSDLTWKIENSYMDLRWANSFGVYGNGDADIIIRGNEFVSTNPYYPDYGAIHVNSFLPSVTVEENIFGKNARIYIDKSVTDTSKVKVSKNYHADGVEKAFADDADGVTVKIDSYYTGVDENSNLTGLVTISSDVAEVNGVKYASLEEAFKAVTAENNVVEILADVTVDYLWNCRSGNGAQFTVPVTINGNNKTIKFTGEVKDNNWNTIFRFEENAIVKDLTIDISEATGTQRVITAKKSLDVDNLTTIGSARYGIIFGEGATVAELANAEISIANSDLNGTRRAISDNEGGKDVKSVTVTGNTLNANVYLSASESIIFNNNTATGEVDLRAYTKGNTLDVTATGNTLNTEKNYIEAGGTINAQPEFYIPAKGSNSLAYTKEVDGYVRVWGQSENTNAAESFALKLYSEDTLMATTVLNDVNNIIDGSQDSVTWNFFYPQSNDDYWTTTWEEGHPNALDKPTKVELYIDGTLVSTTAAQMNGPDGINPVTWEELGGVRAIELPTATVTEISEAELEEKNAPELTFALNFKADEVTDEQLNYYKDWYADYVLTINKDFTANADGSADGYLAGQYDAYSENWVSVPFENVTLEAGTQLRVLKYAIEGNLSDYKTPLTYNDVYGFVKEFNCGIYFDEDYLAENPDLEVTLELRMYNPDESKNETYVIGETYEFDASDIATPVAQIGETTYATFAEALDAVQDGQTITLLNVTGDESKTEIDFDKAISFTITGEAPNYALPVVTFQNAKVTIKDAEILIPELDARQDATINVVDSIVRDAGGNSIVKSYYNGAINISGDSVVHTMQVTTMGYITISNTAKLNATWQTNVYGNGMITVEDTATFATAALHLTGKDYSGRDNPDADRVGKPATIVVDGATLTVGKVYSDSGADYSYNSSHGINIGTIDGKSAVLDAKNGATVNIYMADGQTANIGANGTVNVDNSKLNVACRKEDGVVSLVNDGTISVDNGAIYLTTVNATLTAQEGLGVKSTVDGYGVNYADGKYSLKEIEEVKLFDFYTTTVTLNNSLAINFYVEDKNLSGENYVAKIEHKLADGTVNKVEVPYSEWGTGVAGYHSITYSGLVAKQMSEDVCITIYEGETPVSKTRTDGLRAYAERALIKYADDVELSTALVDMLNYGAAAQEYFGYGVENLANATLTEEQKKLASTSENVKNIQVKGDHYLTTTLSLENNILLTGYFTFDSGINGKYAEVKYVDSYGDPVSYTVNYQDFVKNTDKIYGICVDTLAIADAACEVTITVYNSDGTVYGTLVDSMESYLYRIMQKDNREIFKMIARFTASAYNTLH